MKVFALASLAVVTEFDAWLYRLHAMITVLSFSQGTHICTQPGVFILQWKYSSQAMASRGAPRILHRTKIMYYYEVLPSREFRYVPVSCTPSARTAQRPAKCDPFLSVVASMLHSASSKQESASFTAARSWETLLKRRNTNF